MIGLLGGTFDPVHFGHLRPALEVSQALELADLWLIPLRQAVHRPQPQASPEQRLAMLRLAVGEETGIRIDDRELRRAGQSYTYDTLAEIRAELGMSRWLCLLVGADAFRGFLTWHRPDDILDLVHLVVMQRPALPGEDGHVTNAGLSQEFSAELQTWLQPRRCRDVRELTASPAGRVWFQEVTQLDISSTRIRGLIVSGLSPRFLLPDPVWAYIQARRLYQRP
jgi:nicotinate-nucleotide adenylyltransferase